MNSSKQYFEYLKGEKVAGVLLEEHKEEDDWIAVRPRNKGAFDLDRFLVTTENKTNQWPSHRTSEEEPEWDVNSAFVANAANHIKSKGLKTKVLQISRENKENETRTRQVENTELKRRGESLTVQGIHMFERGQYSQAVETFTAAIYCDPKDHRFSGNRSYCYWFLEQYTAALTDAQRSIKLAPDWAKGYFRKGCALMGLKRYSEAEKAMQQVLELDAACQEASSKLFHCRVLQLMEFGFEKQQSEELLERFTTVQAVLTSSSSTKGRGYLHYHILPPCGSTVFRRPRRSCHCPRTVQMEDDYQPVYWRTTGGLCGKKRSFSRSPDQQGRDETPQRPLTIPPKQHNTVKELVHRTGKKV
ncbi:DNA polymerase interacting tetratricopeptide repeat-containing, protein of 47 kDa-like [Thalassophryne amazonica]|uniref:DNA polymerase interacting tetratricopeptide repeat-containing, protein of 47 kDa-like n=1 Tax=Thalassophryne amazonica TaxID=390379 RepID=UPI0014722C8C|nr:DNA polymerase interacting tetratricopeptide repeat-containing, protein of 47 kDa-like [Thalassophryne amazonica]